MNCYNSWFTEMLTFLKSTLLINFSDSCTYMILWGKMNLATRITNPQEKSNYSIIIPYKHISLTWHQLFLQFEEYKHEDKHASSSVVSNGQWPPLIHVPKPSRKKFHSLSIITQTPYIQLSKCSDSSKGIINSWLNHQKWWYKRNGDIIDAIPFAKGCLMSNL